MYGYTDDDSIYITTGVGLTVAKVVSFLTEEAIFNFAIGYIPQEYDYVVNPFRKEDKTPGCYFVRSEKSGRLCLMDYACTETRHGTKVGYFDCIGAAQLKLGLDIKSTMQYLMDNLETAVEHTPIERIKFEKIPTIIQCRPRNFQGRDKRFWYDKYGITRDNMIEDGTYPISSLHISSMKTKGQIYVKRPNSSAYVFTFRSGHKKVYMPHEKETRFIANVDKNDIGNIECMSFIRDDKDLIITKSYKDCRVLRNMGIDQCIWFQNEGVCPDDLVALCAGYRSVTFLYDNDRQGLWSSNELAEQCEHKDARAIAVPYSSGVSDPADLRHRKGEKALYQYLKNEGLL